MRQEDQEGGVDGADPKAWTPVVSSLRGYRHGICFGSKPTAWLVYTLIHASVTPGQACTEDAQPELGRRREEVGI